VCWGGIDFVASGQGMNIYALQYFSITSTLDHFIEHGLGTPITPCLFHKLQNVSQSH